MPPSALDRSRALQRRTTGIVVVIVSGLIFVAAVGLLDWSELPKVVSVGDGFTLVSHGATLWHAPGHDAAILTLIAVGTVAFAAMGLLSDSVVTALPAVCGAFALLGRIFPYGFGFGEYRAGHWLAVAAALAIAAGGVLAVTAASGFRRPPRSGSPLHR
jgi:hypothetical protein